MKKGEIFKLYRRHYNMWGEDAVTRSTFYNRIDRGRSLDDALNTPSQGHGGARDSKSAKRLWRLAKDGCSYPVFCKYLYSMEFE